MNYFLWLLLFYLVKYNLSAPCGCKVFRECYANMIDNLLDRDEATCIQDAAIGWITIMVYLKALTQYCGDVITFQSESTTDDGRALYEAVISANTSSSDSSKPIILIEAGQEGGNRPTELALTMIEQLVACHENNDMIRKVKWVILPSTNPDGMVHTSTPGRNNWKKNNKRLDDSVSVGVDITRNFDIQWNSCPKITSGFSPNYPGKEPFSEAESKFIKAVIQKYDKNIKIYLSIKRNGHSIGYPYAYTSGIPPNIDNLVKVSSEVASRVNQRAGNVQVFTNNSIHELEGKPHCGHSVDYAASRNIPLSFEMRVYPEDNSHILSRFQSLPRGYESSLATGYINGIKEFYNVLTNSKKYGDIKF